MASAHYDDQRDRIILTTRGPLGVCVVLDDTGEPVDMSAEMWAASTPRARDRLLDDVLRALTKMEYR